MDTIGLDLHKRESQLCIGLDDGQIIEQRIATTLERFTAELGPRSRARILLEASTESEGRHDGDITWMSPGAQPNAGRSDSSNGR
jgi:hypothetical protein